MILRASEIADLIEKGAQGEVMDPLAITPCPNLEHLKRSGAASVDLRLGTWFVSLRRARMPCISLTKELAQPQVGKTIYVPFGKPYYLHPRQFVLAVTLEWLHLPAHLAGYVVGRSSWGRRGLVIATATAVHPGFTGCLTLELANVGELPIELTPGVRISQLVLHHTYGLGTQPNGSQFVGLRRPVVGSVQLDDVAQHLAGTNATEK